MCSGTILTMTDDNIEEIKKENDELIIKFFGLQKHFSPENQDEN